MIDTNAKYESLEREFHEFNFLINTTTGCFYVLFVSEELKCAVRKYTMCFQRIFVRSLRKIGDRGIWQCR